MGLDMYVHSTDVDNLVNPDQQADLELHNSDSAGEFHYWRKFNALHGWMEDLYRRKGGTDPEFNCNSVRLDLEDIHQLEKDMLNDKLTPVQGCFFGSQKIYPEDIESLKVFIKEAQIELEGDTRVLYYSSWW